MLIGTGSALPRNAVSNAELAQRVDTTDEWIVERTGIRNRYIAGPDETDMSAQPYPIGAGPHHASDGASLGRVAADRVHEVSVAPRQHERFRPEFRILGLE